jgi:hypothetical protein
MGMKAMSDDDQRLPEGRPGELVIGTSPERILVRIAADGTLTYGPEYTPDEAAQVFWQALARQREGGEEKMVLLAHVEKLLARIGEQDLRTETARMQASETKSAHDEFQAERATGQLEVLVHELIELARGIALRDRDNAKAAPPKGAPPSTLN